MQGLQPQTGMSVFAKHGICSACLDEEEASVLLCVFRQVVNVLGNARVLERLQRLRLPLKELQLLPVRHAP